MEGVDLDYFGRVLQSVRDECIRRGLPHTIVSRIDSVHHIIPNIEHARQAQDRTNG